IIVSLYSPTIGVFTQKADGTLNPMVIYPSAQAGYDDIEAGDVNGDGRTDVVKMNGQGYANPNLMVYLQNEGGTLDAAITYRIAECPVESPCNANGLGIGDITGDGREDVILSYGGNSPSSKIAVFQQDTNGTLLASVSYPSLDIPDPLEVGDIDSDTRQDLVVLHSGWVNAGVYTQQSTGVLGTEALYPIPYKSWYGSQDLDIADVNEDGFPDLLIADGQGLVVLYHRTPTPTPLAPAGKVSDRTPTYQWTPVSGATQYRYQLLRGTTLVYTKTVLPTLCGTTTCSSTPSTALPDASYTWRVQAMLGTTWGDYSLFKSFSVDAVPTPLAPSGSTYDPTPTYKWTKIIGASQYRYQLMRGTAVVYTRAVSSSICGATACSSTPTAVLPDASYKWRVQAMVGGVWANYSTYKAFGIKTIPTPQAPAGTIWDAAPTFKWSRIPGASGYRFQVMKGTTLLYTKTLTFTTCTATTCSNTPGTILSDNASYQWRVQAIFGSVSRPYSAYKAFTIPPLPKAGFWRNSAGSLEFYVTPDQSAVANFAIRVYVPGCGTYKITRTALAPIANNHFSFSGSFYGNGTFSNTTAVAGSTGLYYFYISGCGYVSGGPFSYSAAWNGSSQPLVTTVQPSAGVDIAEMMEQALTGYYVVELETPAP
ncbi:MAG: FG-GAP repeat domain-containing protein, partial [Bacteroidota bacterium]